jgi:hypothetical protein
VTTPENPHEREEFTRMFAKLAALYPVTVGPSTDAMIAALCDIPSFWVSCGLAAIVVEPGRASAPTIAEIRLATLTAIHSARLASTREAQGKFAPPARRGSELEIHPKHELAWAWVRGFEKRAQLAGLPVELLKMRYDAQEATGTRGRLSDRTAGSVPGLVIDGSSLSGHPGALDDEEVP